MSRAQSIERFRLANELINEGDTIRIKIRASHLSYILKHVLIPVRSFTVLNTR